jgi:outer membrane protein
MKQRASILVLLSLFLLGVGFSAEAEELKIGVINPQKILEATKQGKKVKQTLAEYVQTRQKLLESEAADIKKLETELATQSTVLDIKAKAEKEQSFQQKVAVYQRRVQELNTEVETKKREVLGGFTKAIEQAVREIAEKEKILLVMEKGGGNAGSLVLFNQDSLDLTPRVIKALDSKAGN